MKRTTLGGLLTALLMLCGLLTAPAAAQTFNLDSPHCWIMYQVRHLDLADAWGQFPGATGTIVLDADPAKTSIKVEVKVEGVNSGNPQRDTHLKSPDFFDSKQFPTLSFTSTSAKKSGDTLEVTGDLKIHGVTKPVTVTVKTRQASTPMGNRAGLETSLTIKRSDFGMTTFANVVSDEVKLIIGLEGVRQ